MLLSVYFVTVLSLFNFEYGHGLRMYTSENYWIQSLNQRGLDTTTTSQLTFQVVACSDVHVAFFDSVFGSQTPRYELVIGGWSNTNSTFRQSRKYFINLNHTPLDCCTFHPFWVSWYGGTLKAGHGYRVGQDVFLQLTNSDMGPIIKVGITTGWGHTGVWALSLNNVPLTASDFDVDGYIECSTNTVIYYLPQQQETTLILPSTSYESFVNEMTSNPGNADISVSTVAMTQNSIVDTDLTTNQTYLTEHSQDFKTASEGRDETRSVDISSKSTSAFKQMVTTNNAVESETTIPQPMETSLPLSSAVPEASATDVITIESEQSKVPTTSRTSEESKSTSMTATFKSATSTPTESSPSLDDLETSMSDTDIGYFTTSDVRQKSTSDYQHLDGPLPTMRTDITALATNSMGELETQERITTRTTTSLGELKTTERISMMKTTSLGELKTTERITTLTTASLVDLKTTERTSILKTTSLGELKTPGKISTEPIRNTLMTSKPLISTSSLLPTDVHSEVLEGSISLTNALTSKMDTTPHTLKTTNLPANNCEGCPCCWPLYGIINMTLSEKIERIRRTLTLVKSNLSAARRRLTSAHDIRSSSRYMGASGATILVLVFGIIVLADVQRILAFFIPTQRSALTIIVER